MVDYEFRYGRGIVKSENNLCGYCMWRFNRTGLSPYQLKRFGKKKPPEMPRDMRLVAWLAQELAALEKGKLFAPRRGHPVTVRSVATGTASA